MKHYIICSQPRSGTHYLRALLKQQKCGNSQELFYHLMVKGRIPTLDVFYEEYFKKCIQNDVFGIVINRLHYKPGMKHLRKLSGMQSENDFDVLSTFFPDAKFIYFYRRNKVKQAISFLKAMRSSHYTLKDNPEFGEYSEEKISEFIIHLCASEAQWLSFFEQYGIRPHVLTYEVLCADTTGAISDILDFLEFDSSHVKIDTTELPIRQYDQISEDWYQRYLRNE